MSQGLGLGLVVCKRLVEAREGRSGWNRNGAGVLLSIFPFPSTINRLSLGTDFLLYERVNSLCHIIRVERFMHEFISAGCHGEVLVAGAGAESYHRQVS